MNDLNGLSWDSAPAKPGSANHSAAGLQHSSSLRPFPSSSSPAISRQSSPLSATHSGQNTPHNAGVAATKSANANDSFSSLLGPSVAKKTGNPSNLTLSERQRQLAEEKARQAAAQRERDNALWETLEKGRSSTPVSLTQSNSSLKNTSVPLNKTSVNDSEDILSAFSASAPVDASSHFPPPGSQTNSRSTSRISNYATASISPGVVSTPPTLDNDPDDPFGLGTMPQPARGMARVSPTPAIIDDNGGDDDDDILGDLGKPVSVAKKLQPSMSDTMSVETLPSAPPMSRSNEHPQDKAVAEIVDMGFSIEKAREALNHTETGTDVQSAVGWLLNQAHQESRAQSRSSPDPVGLEARNGSRNGQRRQGAHDSGASERDVAKTASELGSSFFKSANQLWKSGQKRVQKAMAEFQYEGDPNQPKWMQEGQSSHRTQRQTPPSQQDNGANFTNEAAMLESGRSRPAPRQQSRPVEPLDGARVDRGQPNGKPPQGNLGAQKEAQQLRSSTSSLPISRPASRLRREDVETQSAEAYISPARRKKATPAAKPVAPEEPALDIFSSSQPVGAATKPTGPSNEFGGSKSQPQTPPASTTNIRPKPVTRQIPEVSASALSTSASNRQKGTESFKRGDFAEAHSNYSAALSPIPANHPIGIVLRCNRALTAIKTGDPKAAIVDADAAIAAIGASHGEGETISLGQGEPEKPMKEYYSKALMRKAEALENMEKWAEAARVYRQAVEAGVGGAPAIQGRNRCEKAAGGGSSSAAASNDRSASAPPATATATAKRRPPAAARKPAAAPPTRRSALDDLNGRSGGDSEAVQRLRAANAAAAAASDEAFALNDSVDARLTAWKTGKEGNLRGLLASLDTVLWEGAGWNKVGMGDLVLPPRVKIVYMKAIAKCHPDKIPTDATTEQRMISASVFATLNEAWDKFKKDNGL